MGGLQQGVAGWGFKSPHLRERLHSKSCFYCPVRPGHLFSTFGSVEVYNWTILSPMGASESSTALIPPSQKEQAIPNENREPVAQQSDFDPRSPSTKIQRTPVRMKVTTHLPPDPRSPTSDFQRTPLRGVKEQKNQGQVLFPSIEEGQQMEETREEENRNQTE